MQFIERLNEIGCAYQIAIFHLLWHHACQSAKWLWIFNKNVHVIVSAMLSCRLPCEPESQWVHKASSIKRVHGSRSGVCARVWCVWACICMCVCDPDVDLNKIERPKLNNKSVWMANLSFDWMQQYMQDVVGNRPAFHTQPLFMFLVAVI